MASRFSPPATPLLNGERHLPGRKTTKSPRRVRDVGQYDINEPSSSASRLRVFGVKPPHPSTATYPPARQRGVTVCDPERASNEKSKTGLQSHANLKLCRTEARSTVPNVEGLPQCRPSTIQGCPSTAEPQCPQAQQQRPTPRRGRPARAAAGERKEAKAAKIRACARRRRSASKHRKRGGGALLPRVAGGPPPAPAAPPAQAPPLQAAA